MKRILTYSVLALTLGLGAFSPAVMARTKNRRSAEHVAAVKKCNEDYSAALKDARTKKGKDRREAQSAASNAKKQCLASAPK